IRVLVKKRARALKRTRPCPPTQDDSRPPATASVTERPASPRHNSLNTTSLSGNGVSTNTSQAIQIGPSRVPPDTLPELLRPPRQVFAHGRLVALLFTHLVAQQFADQAGDAGVAFGRPDPRPASDVLVERDRDVLEGHGVSVTRISCTKPGRSA